MSSDYIRKCTKTVPKLIISRIELVNPFHELSNPGCQWHWQRTKLYIGLHVIVDMKKNN
jgi:hypothetical protein